MRRLSLLIIRVATPAADREWILGDTLERFDEIANSQGTKAAERWR